MNRFTLNLLAGMVILVGGWAILAPAPAAAVPGEVCCTVTIERPDETVTMRCCGTGRCRADDSECTACDGPDCRL